MTQAYDTGQVQRLQYRTSVEPYVVSRRRAWREGRIVDQPPEGLELPKFNTDKPLYCLWKVPLREPNQPAGDVQGAWMAMDRSSEGGPYDLLYVDSNLNGSLADEQPIMADIPGYSAFKLVKLVLPWKAGPTTYHLSVSLMDSNGQMAYLFESACRHEGLVTIDGKQFRCALIDLNCNGSFNGASSNWWRADVICLAPSGETAARDSRKPTIRGVGRFIEVDGKLYRLEVPPDGTWVRFTPAQDVPTGAVRVKGDIARITVTSKEGMFDRQAEDGLFTVPAGEYGLVRWCSAKTGQWQVPPEPDPNNIVQVKAGQEVAWKLLSTE